MIGIISICNEIATLLSDINEVENYRIVLRGNESLYVYLILSDSQEERIDYIQSALEEIYKLAQIEILEEEDLEDSFYKELFNISEKVILDYGKKRLTYSNEDNKLPHSSKIVTFYSYKGGMGRSTALAAFALYLAIHKQKKVFIVDCDIEAPGFTNFFLKAPGENNQMNGLIEYIFDKKCNLIDSDDIGRYSREVDKVITDQGEIRIMHSGNLNFGRNDQNEKHQDFKHYIQGLSRLDLQTRKYSSDILGDVIKDIEKVFNPDIILLDSRTGINDVFGLAVSRLSDFVVGFFRDDIQSLPGLTYFIQEVSAYGLLSNSFIANAILPTRKSEKERLLQHFKVSVDSILSEEYDGEVSLEVYPIQRNETLEVVGSINEDLDDFYDLIKEKEYKDYNTLFDAIIDKMEDVPDEERFLNRNYQVATEESEEIPQEYLENFSADAINRLSEKKKSELLESLRLKILRIFSENIKTIDLYAENITNVLTDFKNDRFFLRMCMKDLFNLDKYIILGSKGTGKSYLYKALKEDQIVEEIQKFANKEGKFYFLEAINKKHEILTVAKFDGRGLSEEEKYRFWLIYTWQIFLKWINDFFVSKIDDSLKARLEITINKSLQFEHFGDNSITTTWLKSKLKDQTYIQNLEFEYMAFDNFIKTSFPDTKITILYDQLDEMVEPELWDKWIPSLIRVWRNRRFNHIFGKMFLRRDLFNKLVGLTNKNDIRNQAIDIEWSKEEIYSYLIQMIFRPNYYGALWNFMYLTDQSNRTIINQCRAQQKKYKTPVLEDYFLRQQIETLFGKYVRSRDKNFNQESYEWFYTNLKNADDTISIRPFISLLQSALKNWNSGKYRDEETFYPILYQRYYFDPEVRKFAVEKYYRDLVENESGNLPIKYIFEFLSDCKGKSFKKISLKAAYFYNMLELVCKKYRGKEGMKGMTTEKLALLLENTGIVSHNNYGNGMVYKFAFLYKYTLGLKGG